MPSLDMWRSGEAEHALEVEMLDPASFASRGTLSVTGASMSEDYYSDTRASGSVSLLSADDYIELSAIRLWHRYELPNGERGREPMRTFFVTANPGVYTFGGESMTLELSSMLWAMSVDENVFYQVAAGATSKAVFEDICRRTRRKGRVEPGAGDYRFASTTIWDAGSYLDQMFALTEAAGNRVDEDPYGVVTMERYVRPSARSVKHSLRYDDPLVVSSGIERESDELALPGRAWVAWEAGDGDDRRTAHACADVPDGSPLSIGRRGFRVASMHHLSDVEEMSQSEAQRRASRFLASDTEATTTLSVTFRWFGIREGDVIGFVPGDGEPSRKYLVKSADYDFTAWTVRTVLKEA